MVVVVVCGFDNLISNLKRGMLKIPRTAKAEQ